MDSQRADYFLAENATVKLCKIIDLVIGLRKSTWL